MELALQLRPWQGPLERRHPNGTPLAERLANYIDYQGPTACWPWHGYIEKKTGYGTVPINRSPHRVHRVVYELLVEPIPDGLTLDHICHNNSECLGGPLCPHRACCNPAHLEAVTSRANTLRGRTPAGINAAKSHCLRGHAFDDDNTYVAVDGARRCRSCFRGEYPSRGALKLTRCLPVDDARHGTISAYQYWNCRCQACRTARRDATRDYRRRLAS